MVLCLVERRCVFILNGKERRANHCDTRRCGQSRLLDRHRPLGSPRCAETRPPPARRHNSGIIGKTTPPIQDEPTPLVFALHLDAAENNGDSGSRTWVTRNTKVLFVFSEVKHLQYADNICSMRITSANI
ncbi:hypothetical protein HanHA300_Chr03g0092361 [Helianthus annuus]|nr:hypothetical protein HanHA300_Chr03g0092361 [Helianthus annuus]